MSLHSFDPDIAAKVGINAAVIYQNIIFWTQKNMANGRHIHDDHVWTYNSIKAWSDLFPYLSGDQIRRALEKLVSVDLICEGNYNPSAYDRTKWYGVKTQIHLAKTSNGFGENPEPIPDSKPYDKPDGKHLALSAPKEPDLFPEFWDRYPHRNGAKKGKAAALKVWARLIKSGTLPKQIIDGAMRYASDRQVIEGYAKDPATWLNQRGWEDEIEKPTGPKNDRARHSQAINQFADKLSIGEVRIDYSDRDPFAHLR